MTSKEIPMPRLSVTFDLSHIKNSNTVCWDPILFTDNLYTETDPVYQVFNGVTHRLRNNLVSLLCAAPQVGLTELTNTNVLEWIYRLNSLFDAGVSFQTIRVPEGDVPRRLRLQDLKEYLGLKVGSLRPLNNSAFDYTIRKLRWNEILRRAKSLEDRN